MDLMIWYRYQKRNKCKRSNTNQTIDLNESEIDLNECELFHKENLEIDPIKLDRIS